MTPPLIDLASLRSRQAKLTKLLTAKSINYLLALTGLLLASGSLVIILLNDRRGYLLLSGAILLFMMSIWSKWSLLVLSPDSSSISGRLAVDILVGLKKSDNNPRAVWKALANQWQAYFLSNHLYISPSVIEQSLSDRPEDLALALTKAGELADSNHNPTIELGFLAAGLMLSSPQFAQLLDQTKLHPDDIAHLTAWLNRILDIIHLKKQKFGGIGRDWSFGFTNFLNHYAYNLSQEIQMHGSNFGWLTNSTEVLSIESALANNAAAIAIIGAPGIGKTSRVYALAQRMIEGIANKKVAYHQILQLDVATILASAKKPGEIEYIFKRIIDESSRAGHIILFLDDAELFFNQGVGSVNASSILQPILQNRAIPFILTLTPADFQRLRTNNQALANLLTPIILTELPQASIMNILEDTAAGMEHQFNCLITYNAIKTAYRLSGRYNLDEAYPGKAIKLLEQSISLAEDKVISQASVEAAIEQTRGVKVSSVGPVEADSLLRLEDQIHQRMINQSEAVKVVSSALRRARAGIGDPKRPIGSFLFLGPTGVGKTELAKAIAAIYFGSEQVMIRLDMSEYQQESDITRLLAMGSSQTISFLMRVRQQPFSVVLLDEVEKAHPSILNLLLQLLDEGQLTDLAGNSASFKDAVIIATSNAGANAIREQLESGGQLEEFKDQLTNQLIKDNIFKPELLNRFDEIVLFRSLNRMELSAVVKLLLIEVNKNLSSQNITVKLSAAAIDKIVDLGSDDRFGARPMRRALQRGVEDTMAQKILTGAVGSGDQVLLDATDITL